MPDTADSPGDAAPRVFQGPENAALDRAAGLVVDELEARGMRVRLISDRMNRRKIELVVDPAWGDPPKSRLGELLDVVLDRLAGAHVSLYQRTIETFPRAVRQLRRSSSSRLSIAGTSSMTGAQGRLQGGELT